MKGKGTIDCTHKKTGIKGKIIVELNSFNPPQYGILWDITDESRVQNHSFWNDKKDIDL